jgi:hypothetical protein
LLQITFLLPETITHKIAIFQTQQTAPLLPLPEINFNLPRRICVTRDQPRPGSFLKKREEPGNEVERNRATEDRASVSQIVVSCACAATHKNSHAMVSVTILLIFFVTLSLSERTQVTAINNISSQKYSLQCEVPQGSILGPRLFVIYINDLSDCNIMSDCRRFADDTNLTYADKDYNHVFPALNSDLNILKSWLDRLIN